ncbi:unnamed protein product [Schistosoma turkestanicum]|nr:unnamed protein product [Schistosoma turkestanicum]
MILTVKKNKLFPFLFHFSEKLRRQHRNTNDPIIKYMDCEMEVQMNFQKSILMKGVKLEKSSEKQVCFNHKQRTFDIKNQIDSHIRAFSISIRYYNYELLKDHHK